MAGGPLAEAPVGNEGWLSMPAGVRKGSDGYPAVDAKVTALPPTLSC